MPDPDSKTSDYNEAPPSSGFSNWFSSCPCAQILKLSLFSAFVAISALILTNIGWILLIDFAISDSLYFSAKRNTSGRTVLLVIDQKTIDKSRRLPFDRTMLADALDVIAKSKPRRIYLDTTLNVPWDKEGDGKLAKALAQFGPGKIALPVYRSGGSPTNPVLVRPQARFAKHVSLVTMDFVLNSDRRMRSTQSIKAADATEIQHWLLGKDKAGSKANSWIDFSLNPATLKRYSLIDVAQGKVAPSQFNGKRIIFGRISTHSSTGIDVPNYKKLSRTEFAGLLVETVEAGRNIGRSSLVEMFFIIFILSMLFGAILTFTPWTSPVLLFVGFSSSWVIGCHIIFQQTGRMLPIAATIVAFAIIWQRATIENSGPTSLLRRLRTKLMGIDKASLLTVIEAVPEPAVLYDKQGRIMGKNAAFSALASETGKTISRTTTLTDLFGPAGHQMIDCFKNNKLETISFTAELKKTGIVEFETAPRQIGTSTGAIGIAGLKDVTAAKERESELMQLAFRDPLTKLGNRLEFQARLEAACDPELNKKIAIFIIDLDGFKAVNDTLGHEAGDKLLIGVGRRLTSLLDPTQTAARLGGDEFALIIEYEEEGDTLALANAILSSLATPFIIDAKPARVGGSIGIAYYPKHSNDPQETVRLADMAMYVAKKNKPAFSVYEIEHQALAS